MNEEERAVDRIVYLGSTQKDIRKFPDPVSEEIANALDMAAHGEEHEDVKPLRHFHGRTTLEVIENFQGDTYRAVYTVRFTGFVFVLHAFQKKSTQGISTPKKEIDLIQVRLRAAQSIYQEFQAAQTEQQKQARAVQNPQQPKKVPKRKKR